MNERNNLPKVSAPAVSAEGRRDLIARVDAEARMLEAQMAGCEHSLHGTAIGCPYCQRDLRQSYLLRDVLAALARPEPATADDERIRMAADKMALSIATTIAAVRCDSSCPTLSREQWTITLIGFVAQLLPVAAPPAGRPALTPSCGDVFLDLGFSPDEAAELRRQSDAKIAKVGGPAPASGGEVPQGAEYICPDCYHPFDRCSHCGGEDWQPIRALIAKWSDDNLYWIRKCDAVAELEALLPAPGVAVTREEL
jgi:hypothetical protein